MRRLALATATVVLAAAVLAACSGGTDDGDADGPTVVVTTGVLGDVVRTVLGDAARVEVVMPAGTDPHRFQPSAAQVASMRDATLVVANGADLEESLEDVLSDIAGDVPVFSAIDAVETLPGGEHGTDPHFFTDPGRMADAVAALGGFLADEVPALATDEVADRAGAYEDELRELVVEIEGRLAPIPPEDRAIVTDHDVFAYFADRFGFTVAGSLVGGGGTHGQPSGGELDAIVSLIDGEGVRLIAVDHAGSTDLADNVAAEADADVAVVSLHMESLGDEGSPTGTYVGAVRDNAERIAEALI